MMIPLLHLSALVAIAVPATPSFTSSPVQEPSAFTLTVPKSVGKVEMMPIPGGELKVGGETVKVKPFYMAATEMPWEFFDAFLTSGPPSKPYDQTKYAPDTVARPSQSYILPDLGWGHRGYPVINVSFTNVEMFCRWLSQVTGKKYRVPTEAEWELACLAGQPGPIKPNADEAEKLAWFGDNSDDMTHPVGKKEANKFGLHDMLGNVGEWATDAKGEPVLCGPTFLDPLEKVNSAERKRWSPAWQETDPQMPKSRWWLSDGPFAGFRVVCEM